MKRLLGSIVITAAACSSASPTATSASPPAAKSSSPGHSGPPAQTVLGPPTLTEASRSLPTLPWENYRALTKDIDRFPTLQAEPEGAGSAWFGLNLVIDAQNRSYVLLPRGDGQWGLHVDGDGDGAVDVSGEGWSLSADFTRRTVGTGASAYEAAFRVLTQPDGSPRLEVRAWSKRTGELHVEGQAYAVELVGYGSNYDRAGATLRVDVDRSGEFDPDPLGSETFDVTSRAAYVSIGATHLGFSVGEGGSHIAWALRPDVTGPRPSVAIGAPAPDFPPMPSLEAADVMPPQPPFVLEFFSPGCEFCAEAAPHVAAAAAGPLGETGAHIVSIEHGDSGEGRDYAQKTGKTWTVFIGDEATTVSELYRVESVPTYVVVGADGTICARGNWRTLGPELSAGELCPSDAPD